MTKGECIMKMKTINILENIAILLVLVSLIFFISDFLEYSVKKFIIGELLFSTGIVLAFFCKSYIVHLYTLAYGELNE